MGCLCETVHILVYLSACPCVNEYMVMFVCVKLSLHECMWVYLCVESMYLFTCMSMLMCESVLVC